jgi:hypothetical protein
MRCAPQHRWYIGIGTARVFPARGAATARADGCVYCTHVGGYSCGRAHALADQSSTVLAVVVMSPRAGRTRRSTASTRRAGLAARRNRCAFYGLDIHASVPLCSGVRPGGPPSISVMSSSSPSSVPVLQRLRLSAEYAGRIVGSSSSVSGSSAVEDVIERESSVSVSGSSVELEELVRGWVGRALGVRMRSGRGGPVAGGDPPYASMAPIMADGRATALVGAGDAWRRGACGMGAGEGGPF